MSHIETIRLSAEARKIGGPKRIRNEFCSLWLCETVKLYRLVLVRIQASALEAPDRRIAEAGHRNGIEGSDHRREESQRSSARQR